MNATSTAFYRTLLDHLSDGVYFVDNARHILFWNEAAFRLTGYKSEEVVGRCCEDNLLQHVDDAGHELCRSGCPLTASISDGLEREALVHLRHKDGRRVPVYVRVQPVRDESGSVVGAIETFSNDSAHAQARLKSEEMRRLAYLDSVTGIPNRRFAEMALASALEELSRGGRPVGVLMMDLDELKRINDTYGHCIGDRALRSCAQALAASFRPTDVIGRWGGDEFVAVVRDVRPNTLRLLARRCVRTVARALIDDGAGGAFSVRISLGAALAGVGDTVQTVVSRADGLMYENKTQGRVAAD